VPIKLNLPSELLPVVPTETHRSDRDVSEEQRWSQRFRSLDVQLLIKRDDCIHPVISGNKARKLIHFMDRAEQVPPQGVVTMGGNRSNFLHALGYFCFEQGIPLKVYIRGHRPKVLHRTLSDLTQWQVDLEFIDKEHFSNLRERAPVLDGKYRDWIWLPEGGSNLDAVLGIEAAIFELDWEPNYIFVPVGTGATALGLALGCASRGWSTKVIGIVALKGAHQLDEQLQHWAQRLNRHLPVNLHLDHRFCGRGFGKIDQKLIDDQRQFETLLGCPLEPVYSVKALRGLHFWLCEELIAKGSRIIYWHTGGLQGNSTQLLD